MLPGALVLLFYGLIVTVGAMAAFAFVLGLKAAL